MGKIHTPFGIPIVKAEHKRRDQNSNFRMDALSSQHSQDTEKRLVRRLEKLGYQVTLQSDNPAA